MIFGGDGEYGVLDVFIFVYLCLIKGLVEVGRIIVLVGDANPDELCNCKFKLKKWKMRTKANDFFLDSAFSFFFWYVKKYNWFVENHF